MDADFLDAFFLRFFDHREEVGDVGVDVAVREQAQEVEGGIVFLNVLDFLVPGFGFIHLAGADGFVDELRALGIDLAAA